jgi:hypothetical protein
MKTERHIGMSDVEYFYPEESYYELVEKNADVLIEHTLGSYQGDMLFLLRNGDQFGFLVVGYGSCSGCDSLEACESQEAVDSLAERIYDGIKWFDSFDELKSYVLDDNKDLEWYAHEGGWPEFLEKVKNYV